MKIQTKQLKVFGYGLAVIMAFFAWRFWAQEKNLSWVPILGAASLLFACVTTFRLEALIPFYTRWMKVAQFIGSIVTVLILSIIFYFVFGIVGIMLRLLRKDLLDQTMDRRTVSYWHKRPQTEFQKDRYRKQF